MAIVSEPIGKSMSAVQRFPPATAVQFCDVRLTTVAAGAGLGGAPFTAVSRRLSDCVAASTNCGLLEAERAVAECALAEGITITNAALAWP